MATQPTRRPISKGLCAFCNTELAKNKMTQHLKSCKQRLAAIASEEERSQETKTRLFHILAEGQYNPRYWLHFEVPASAALWAVDDFLKAMWISDLDHLSGFEINGTNYRDTYSDDLYSFVGVKDIEYGMDKEEKTRRTVEHIISLHLGMVSLYVERSSMPDPLSAEWIAELKKPRSVDELVDFLKEELARITTEDKQIWKLDSELPPLEQFQRQQTVEHQKSLVKHLLEKVEDRSIGVTLARVLKVGQKFSYVYDFGSSTYINLRVIAEREGIVQDEKKPVQLLARNTAPGFLCSVCGKPATMIAMGYYYGDDEGSVYCDACGKKKRREFDAMLPIINSPRVGVL